MTAFEGLLFSHGLKEYIRSSEFMDIFDIPRHLENTVERELTAVLS